MNVGLLQTIEPITLPFYVFNISVLKVLSQLFLENENNQGAPCITEIAVIHDLPRWAKRPFCFSLGGWCLSLQNTVETRLQYASEKYLQ